jgi:hypothetical protein
LGFYFQFKGNWFVFFSQEITAQFMPTFCDFFSPIQLLIGVSVSGSVHSLRWCLFIVGSVYYAWFSASCLYELPTPDISHVQLDDEITRYRMIQRNQACDLNTWL